MQRLVLAVFSAFAILAAGQAACAHEFKIGDIEIIHPVARPTMGAALNSSVYLTIRNGGETDTLVDVYGPDADKVELHASVMDGDIMTMQHLDEGIEIPAGGELHLASGGHHIMLMELAEPLHVYDTFALTLVFERAGAIEVEVYVVDPADLEDLSDHDMNDGMESD